MLKEIFGQVFSVVAMILMIASYQFKTKKIRL